MRGGFEALKASIAPGPVPVKTEGALRVITREGVAIGKSQLSPVPGPGVVPICAFRHPGNRRKSP
jgi:hypothetical protein